MRVHRALLITTLSLCIPFSALAQGSEYHQAYVVHDLGIIRGSLFPSISASSQVTFQNTSLQCMYQPAFSNAVQVLAGTSPDVYGAGINANGWIVGRAFNAAGFFHAFRSNGNTNYALLTNPVPTAVHSAAAGVDIWGNVAVVAGEYNFSTVTWTKARTFLLPPSNALPGGGTPLEIRGGCEGGITVAIAIVEGPSLSNPVIAGFAVEACTASGAPADAQRAFVWKSGTFSFLPEPADSGQSAALDVNSSGIAVGFAVHPVNTRKPVKWSPGGLPIVLPLLSGDTEGVARGINNCDVVVGWGEDAAGSPRALVWNPSETNPPPIDLTQQIVSPGMSNTVMLRYAVDINPRGQILCVGRRAGEGAIDRAFVLDPNVCLLVPGCISDVSRNGIVDFNDVTIVIQSFGAMCP